MRRPPRRPLPPATPSETKRWASQDNEAASWRTTPPRVWCHTQPQVFFNPYLPTPAPPPPSVLEWLKVFASDRGLDWRQDAKGNVVIVKPGQAGGEGAAPVILQASRGVHTALAVWRGAAQACVRGSPLTGQEGSQAPAGVQPASVRRRGRRPRHPPTSTLTTPPATRPHLRPQGHVDMVCEKNSDCAHDFERDPIQLALDGGWLRARGTTLGADNGVGEAACHALARGGGGGRVRCVACGGRPWQREGLTLAPEPARTPQHVRVQPCCATLPPPRHSHAPPFPRH